MEEALDETTLLRLSESMKKPNAIPVNWAKLADFKNISKCSIFLGATMQVDMKKADTEEGKGYCKSEEPGYIGSHAKVVC